MRIYTYIFPLGYLKWLIVVKREYKVLLPPKLYLVVFYQVSLVNWIRITCSDFRRPSVLLLGSFVVLYHMFTPPWGSCKKCPNMIVSVKDSVS